MNEVDGYEIRSFVISTPDGCVINRTSEQNDEDIECILKELAPLGVTEVGYYADYFITVDRLFDMTLAKQYQLVVEGLKRILK